MKARFWVLLSCLSASISVEGGLRLKLIQKATLDERWRQEAVIEERARCDAALLPGEYEYADPASRRQDCLDEVYYDSHFNVWMCATERTEQYFLPHYHRRRTLTCEEFCCVAPCLLTSTFALMADACICGASWILCGLHALNNHAHYCYREECSQACCERRYVRSCISASCAQKKIYTRSKRSELLRSLDFKDSRKSEIQKFLEIDLWLLNFSFSNGVQRQTGRLLLKNPWEMRVVLAMESSDPSNSLRALIDSIDKELSSVPHENLRLFNRLSDFYPGILGVEFTIDQLSWNPMESILLTLDAFLKGLQTPAPIEEIMNR